MISDAENDVTSRLYYIFYLSTGYLAFKMHD